MIYVGDYRETGSVTLDLRHRFAAGRGYLGAATLGLPADVTVAALRRDVETYATGTVDVMEYTALVERARGYAATLLGVVPSRVAVGSQASVFIGLAAAAAPPGAEVVCVAGDFASVVRPFLARGDLRVRQVPLAELAGAVGPDTWMVAYALVSSSTASSPTPPRSRRPRGRRAPECWSTSPRRRVGYRRPTSRPTSSSATRTSGSAHRAAARSLPSPSERRRRSGRSPRAGTRPRTRGRPATARKLDLAPDASRYDVSPAWHAWVGAEAALGFAVSLDAAEVHDHAVGLANGFRERIGLGPSDSAIVSWPDPGGAHLAAFGAAGIAAAGRAGRARVSFHLWNDEEDVDLAARTLGR